MDSPSMTKEKIMEALLRTNNDKQELLRIRDEKDGQLSLLQEELKSLKQLIAQATSREDVLAEENKNLRDQVDMEKLEFEQMLSQQSEQARQESIQLELVLDEMKSALEAEEAKSAQLLDQIKTLELANVHSVDVLRGNDETAKQLALQESEQLRKTVQDLREELLRQDVIKSDLEQKNQRIQQSLDQSVDLLHQTELEYQTKIQEMMQAHASVLDIVVGEKTEIQRALDNCLLANQVLQNESDQSLQSVREELNQSLLKIHSLQTESEHAALLQQTEQSLQEKLEQSLLCIQSLQEEVNQSALLVQSLQKESSFSVQSLQEELDQSLLKTQSLQEELDQSFLSLQSLQVKMNHLQEEHDHSLRASQSLQDELQQVLQTVQTLQEERNQLKEENEEYLRKVQTYQEEWNQPTQLQTKYDESLLQVQTLQQELDQALLLVPFLQQELDQAKNSIQVLHAEFSEKMEQALTAKQIEFDQVLNRETERLKHDFSASLGGLESQTTKFETKLKEERAKCEAKLKEERAKWVSEREIIEEELAASNVRFESMIRGEAGPWVSRTLNHTHTHTPILEYTHQNNVDGEADPEMPVPVHLTLENPVIQTILQAWTRDKDNLNFFNAWCQQILRKNGDLHQVQRGVELNQCTNQVKDGILTMLVPMLRTREGITVSVFTRERVQVVYDIRLKVNPLSTTTL